MNLSHRIVPTQAPVSDHMLRFARDSREVVAALAFDSNARWTFFEHDKWDLSVLNSIEASQSGRQADGSGGIDRGLLASDVVRLFDESILHDPMGVFPSSAGIPLGIAGWSSVERLLRLRRLSKVNRAPYVVLMDSASRNLPNDVRNESLETVALLLSVSTLAKFIRSLLRRLLAGPVLSEQRGQVCWVTVGRFLADSENDVYFARWPWATSTNPVRIFQQGGHSIRLRSSQDQLPFEGILDWVDLFGAFKDVVCAIKTFKSLNRQIFNQWLLSCIWRDEIRSGNVYILALQKRAWKRLIEKLEPREIVFPYEARGWERSLVRQARVFGVRTLGYQHSSLTPRHHGMLVQPARETPDWIPDRVLCCGEITADRLSRAGTAYKGRLRVGVALRVEAKVLPSPGPSVLVALSSSRHEAKEIFKLFHAACGLGIKHPLIFRPHPTIPVRDLFDAYKWPANASFSQGTSLGEDLSKSWCIAYNSSTVVIEGMRYGRIPLYVDIGDILSGDPLDIKLPFKLCADSAEAIQTYLDNYSRSSQRKNQMCEEAKVYADRYLITPTEARVSVMSRLLEQK